jgi:hypothetical protein
MLKTRVIRADGKADKVEITAYSYRGEDRVDYVNRMGGDGRIHTIPVHWIEYIPLTRILYSLLTVVLSGRIIGFIQRIGKKKEL